MALDFGTSTRFRRKPTEVDAMQFTGQNLVQIKLMLGAKAGKVHRTAPDAERHTSLVCETLEGPVALRRGSWVVKGSADEVWPVRDDIFRATYEPIGKGN